MTITAVTAAVVSADLHTPFVTAVRSVSTVETVVVTIADDAGNAGRGEGPQTWRITGESLASVTGCVDGPLKQVLLGRDPDDLNAILDDVDASVVGNNVAKAAVDVALHDLAAQRLGVPLTRLLGGGALSVATDVTLAAGEIPQLVAAAEKRAAEGFSTLKVKVGTDPAGDADRLAAIRRAVGDGIGIRIDANQGWSAKQSVRIIRDLEDRGVNVELVEQPTPARDLEALAFVTSRVDTVILADEAVATLTDLHRMIELRAADAVNVKLTKCGGLRSARTMLETARQFGIGATVGSMMEGRIGVAAVASLAAACGTTAKPDLDAAWWLAGSDPALTYRDGTVRLPDCPGLSAIGRATDIGGPG